MELGSRMTWMDIGLVVSHIELKRLSLNAAMKKTQREKENMYKFLG